MEKIFKIADAFFILSMVIYWSIKLFSDYEISESLFLEYVFFLISFLLIRVKIFSKIKGLIL